MKTERGECREMEREIQMERGSGSEGRRDEEIQGRRSERDREG